MDVLKVSERLGGGAYGQREIRGIEELRDLVAAGLPVAAIEHVLSTDLLTMDEVEKLVVSRRTVERARRGDGSLSPEVSDRLVRVVRVAVKAEEVLDSPEIAAEWLRARNRALGGLRPIDLLGTDLGAQMVTDVLGRIAYGVYS